MNSNSKIHREDKGVFSVIFTAVLFSVCLAQVACAQVNDGKQLAAGVTAYDQGDYRVAIQHFRKASEAGNAEAQYRLGRMYRKGQGIAKNDNYAVKWYVRSAEQGYAPAESNLGFMYQHGFGVVKDYTQAVYWYQRSAAQGYPKGMGNLGNMYNEGWGVKADYGKAFSLFSAAAEQGVKSAQHNLGYMYETGRFVSRNQSKANYWFRRSQQRETVSNASTPNTPSAGTVEELLARESAKVLQQIEQESSRRQGQFAICNQECGIKGGYGRFYQYSDPLAACMDACYSNFR